MSTTKSQNSDRKHRTTLGHPILIGLVVLALIVAAGLTSCAKSPDCGSIKTAPTGKERLFDIVYDVTADAVNGTFPSPLLTKIYEGARRSDVFAAGAVQGTASSDFWKFEGYTAHPVSDDESRRVRLARMLAECVVNRTSTMRAKTPDTNLLAALQRVGDHIANRPRPATVAVISNGLNNTAPLDLRQLIARSTSVDEIVTQLAAGGHLPSLTGAEVTFYGLGDSHPDDPPLPKPYQDWVESLWTAICFKAGAVTCEKELGVAGSGRPSDPPSDAPFPELVPAAITNPEHPVIGDAMFEPGSARLSPDADAALEPVVEWLRAPHHTVSVVGHTASWGTEDYRLSLSRERAQAVANRIAGLGGDPTRIADDGVGSRQPKTPDTDPVTGELVTAAAVANRRVEIFLNDAR
ncbi:OmpA family protein [Streptosporangium sp. H16]|uniref:OmpA family protein n=1 Tax=Streptosporangium sp. H16 TaxID=3444184 RepID=UPI003F799DD8